MDWFIKNIITNVYLYIFLFLGLLKGILEVYVRKNTKETRQKIKQKISYYFLISGSLTPLMILTESIINPFKIPLILCIIFTVLQIILWLFRAVCVKTLGDYYSVDVIVGDDHKLIKHGIYKYVKHPIYIIAVLENVFYPLAAGAFFTAIILTLFVTPALFLRIIIEEKKLINRFGDKYKS